MMRVINIPDKSKAGVLAVATDTAPFPFAPPPPPPRKCEWEWNTIPLLLAPGRPA